MTLTNPANPHIVKTVLVDSTNAASISIEDWVRYEIFVLSAGVTSPSAKVTITVPAIPKGFSVLKNELAQAADVTIDSQSESVARVAAGDGAMLLNDGSNLRSAGNEFPPLIGCALRNESGLTGQNISAAETTLDMDTEIYDTHGFHEGVTNPDRITFPAEFNGWFFDIAMYAQFTQVATNEYALCRLKHFNSADEEQDQWVRTSANAASVGRAVVIRPQNYIQVSTGDYLTSTVFISTDTSVTIVGRSGISAHAIARGLAG